MTGFVLRNMELFFKDRMAVIMSLLAEIIMMILYIIFMRDNLLKGLSVFEEANKLLDAWMLAGILSITPVTASMALYSIMIDDKLRQIDKDFKISPLGNNKMITGYVLSAFIAGLIMSMGIIIL